MTVSSHSLFPSTDTSTTAPTVPDYLEQTYWWAYVHPRAVRFFEQAWIVNFILFGNYRRLCNRALKALGQPISGSTLQVACVYGNLTPQLIQRLDTHASLQVVDVLPIQLANLAAKLAPDTRVQLRRGDSTALDDADASHDQVLLFFLLHEQPEAARRATLREALRVVKPGGRVVIVDYHKPCAWHPLKPLMKRVFQRLEPFAHDLWDHPVTAFLPHDVPAAVVEHTQLFGGLYQVMVLER